MRLVFCALLCSVFANPALGQIIGNCTLHELADTAGDCLACPPGGSGYANCTIQETTYDSWCAGACLYNRICVADEHENVPVYIEYVCMSACGDSGEPECSLPEIPVEILYSWMPSGCVCQPPET